MKSPRLTSVFVIKEAPNPPKDLAHYYNIKKEAEPALKRFLDRFNTKITSGEHAGNTEGEILLLIDESEDGILHSMIEADDDREAERVAIQLAGRFNLSKFSLRKSQAPMVHPKGMQTYAHSPKKNLMNGVKRESMGSGNSTSHGDVGDVETEVEETY